MGVDEINIYIYIYIVETQTEFWMKLFANISRMPQVLMVVKYICCTSDSNFPISREPPLGIGLAAWRLADCPKPLPSEQSLTATAEVLFICNIQKEWGNVRVKLEHFG